MELLKLNSSGPNVEVLQSNLKKLGYYTGNVDGKFGNQTQTAVKNFQRNFGVSVDGIVGNDTWNKLLPYLNGYSFYQVRSGDTLYSLANTFNTNIARLLMANPNITSPNRLFPGQTILIPFNNIVPTDISYTYRIMESNIRALSLIYPFLQIFRVGTSVLGKTLPVIRLGLGSKEVFYNASFHANEWITSVVLMKFIEDYANAYTLDSTLYGYRIRDLFQSTSIYIMPMVNPDGVDLVTGSISSQSRVYQNAKEISKNYPEIPFPSGWKANIKGVDLNLQFPARMGKCKRNKICTRFYQSCTS